MKRAPSLKVTGIGRHLEFFQWFATTLGARRTEFTATNADTRGICAKVIPCGLGVCYSKFRGAELLQFTPGTRSKTGYWELYASRHYRNHHLNFSYDAPLYHDIPPDIAGRLAWWRDIPVRHEDIRKTAALAVILSYRPQPAASPRHGR